jgi:hypothetical protein
MANTKSISSCNGQNSKFAQEYETVIWLGQKKSPTKRKKKKIKNNSSQQ